MNFARKKGFWRIVQESLSRGLAIGILFSVVGIAAAFIMQDRFKASADFMISSTQEGQDYYTATRSAEYMSRVLGEVLYSENFITAVTDTGRVDPNFLPRDKKARLEKWSKMLQVEKNTELGFIHVTLSAASEQDAARVSQAVIQALDKDNGALFGDSGNKVKIRLLSGPIIESNPSASSLTLIVVVGLLLGVFSVIAVRLMKEEFRADFQA